MAIFRGTGGAGDASANVSINQVTEKALEAEASATAAASSATAAAASASTASGYVVTIETYRNEAIAARDAAQTAQTGAETAETNAETAQAAAETAQTAAETAETNAASSATSAASSATSASTSATNAATSATAAATSATNAATSETNAATSETNAATSATSASNSATASASSATDAQTAQTAAESARDSTLAAFDNFDDRYLGAKASDPSVDNDGDALVAGALYFDTTNEVMKLYTGSAWVIAYADFSNADTDDLAEGSTNLYYTDARVGSYLTTNSYATQTYVNTATANSANWDTAYGWGDHSTQGYLTAVPSEYLTQTEGDARYDAIGSALALSIALG